MHDYFQWCGKTVNSERTSLGIFEGDFLVSWSLVRTYVRTGCE